MFTKRSPPKFERLSATAVIATRTSPCACVFAVLKRERAVIRDDENRKYGETDERTDPSAKHDMQIVAVYCCLSSYVRAAVVADQ